MWFLPLLNIFTIASLKSLSSTILSVCTILATFLRKYCERGANIWRGMCYSCCVLVTGITSDDRPLLVFSSVDPPHLCSEHCITHYYPNIRLWASWVILGQCWCVNGILKMAPTHIDLNAASEHRRKTSVELKCPCHRVQFLLTDLIS